MKIRGERECQSCGTLWSYYETGTINCPECGSVRSVGVDERTEHTDYSAALDLSAVTAAIDSEPFESVATRAAEQCREYVRQRGFIHGGDLKPLDDTYLVAVHLQHVATELARSMRVTDAEEQYFLALVREADDGVRPSNSEVPESLESAHGLATAACIDAYRRDLARHLAEESAPEIRSTMERLVDHKKRLEALDGSVPIETADALLQSLADLSHYAVSEDESAIAAAQQRLDDIEE